MLMMMMMMMMMIVISHLSTSVFSPLSLPLKESKSAGTPLCVLGMGLS